MEGNEGYEKDVNVICDDSFRFDANDVLDLSELDSALDFPSIF